MHLPRPYHGQSIASCYPATGDHSGSHTAVIPDCIITPSAKILLHSGAGMAVTGAFKFCCTQGETLILEYGDIDAGDHQVAA